MKELYLTIAILCFLVAVMVYCVNKAIQVLRELHYAWKKYKQSQKDFEFFVMKNFKERK